MRYPTELPETIVSFVGNAPFQTDQTGCSGSEIRLYADKVLKIEKVSSETETERCMLQWLQDELRVPQILAYTCHAGFSYLLMSRLRGRMACDPDLLKDPQSLVHHLAEGLRQFRCVSPVSCPFNQTITNKLAAARIRIENELIDLNDAEPGTYGPDGFKDPRDLWQYLAEHKPGEELAFVHGDYCLPNVLIDDGQVSGFIDLGRSGVGDQWQDIALCVRSLRHNYGSDQYKPLFFAALDVPPDEEKIQYYILLDELY